MTLARARLACTKNCTSSWVSMYGFPEISSYSSCAMDFLSPRPGGTAPAFAEVSGATVMKVLK